MKTSRNQQCTTPELWQIGLKAYMMKHSICNWVDNELYEIVLKDVNIEFDHDCFRGWYLTAYS